ncbi:hypothetical protein JCM3774_005281 [Rhodotorula dairenensis]
MLRIQRVLANGEQTEGTIAYSDKEGLPRSYESIREELATVYGQRVELGVLHNGVELDLYPSVWSILVRPGTILTVKASTGLGTALSGRNTPRSPPTPYEQVGQVSDAYTIAQRLEALAELDTDGVVTGHDYAMARSKLPKPKRPKCNTASSGPSHYDSATPQTPVATKAYSAPVSAVERIEDDDTFRPVRTQTDRKNPSFVASFLSGFDTDKGGRMTIHSGSTRIRGDSSATAPSARTLFGVLSPGAAAHQLRCVEVLFFGAGLEPLRSQVLHENLADGDTPTRATTIDFARKANTNAAGYQRARTTVLPRNVESVPLSTLCPLTE